MTDNKPFVLSAKVIILDKDNRCLLLQRSGLSKGNPGKWDFPGGKADKCESFQDALLREVKGETGLSISLTGVAGAAQSESEKNRIAYLIMEGRAESGDVKISDEHQNYAWVALSNLSNYDLAPQFIPFAKSYSLGK